MPFAALPTSTGARMLSLTPLRRQASSSGSETSSPSRYLVEHVVVGLGRGLQELVAPRRHLIGELVGDRDLDLVRAVPLVRLAMDEVDIAVERVGGPDRDLERRDLVAERRAQRVERRRRVGVLTVALVDEETGRRPGLAAQGDGLLEAGLDAGRCIHHEERPVGGGEPLDDLGDEIRVAGHVDQRDPRPVVLEGADREAQRLAPLLLLGLEVEMGACHRRRDRVGGSPRR